MRRSLLAAGCVACALLFGLLGGWQLERLAWKRDLIARVSARTQAAATAPPAHGVVVTRAEHEYLRVTVHGVLLNDRETLVQAVTAYGPGWWVVTPLQTDAGVVLVNRGFVPEDRREPAARGTNPPARPVQVGGLLRLSEPNGGFLRANDPGAGRWYSRDVAAIAKARHLTNVAPYFVDADAASTAGGYPVGGLTVIAFRNAHLVYALTWFALAALSLSGLWVLFRSQRAG